jgi:hypothetical protein
MTGRKEVGEGNKTLHTYILEAIYPVPCSQGVKLRVDTLNHVKPTHYNKKKTHAWHSTQANMNV